MKAVPFVPDLISSCPIVRQLEVRGTTLYPPFELAGVSRYFSK